MQHADYEERHTTTPIMRQMEPHKSHTHIVWQRHSQSDNRGKASREGDQTAAFPLLLLRLNVRTLSPNWPKQRLITSSIEIIIFFKLTPLIDPVSRRE